jgi:hypothetical protein
MKKAILEINEDQLLSALEQLPGNDLKRIIDRLFSKGLLKKPDFKAVAAKTKRAVRKSGIGTEVVEEAIQWARKQK